MLLQTVKELDDESKGQFVHSKNWQTCPAPACVTCFLAVALGCKTVLTRVDDNQQITLYDRFVFHFSNNCC